MYKRQRQETRTSDLVRQLKDLFARRQPDIQQQLSQPILPPETLARLGIAWEACVQQYSSLAKAIQDHESGRTGDEHKDAFNALITQIEACWFDLSAALQDHNLQKQYWDAQGPRRAALETFLKPDGKESWNLKTLLAAQREVADAHFEALKCARMPDYVEAGRLLNQAWRAYRDATALHDQQGQVATQLLNQGGLQAVRDTLDDIDTRLTAARAGAAESLVPHLQNLQAESRRHRESLRLHIEAHQRALSEDIDPPQDLACQAAVTALHGMVTRLNTPQSQQGLQALQACLLYTSPSPRD